MKKCIIKNVDFSHLGLCEKNDEGRKKVVHLIVFNDGFKYS